MPNSCVLTLYVYRIWGAAITCSYKEPHSQSTHCLLEPGRAVYCQNFTPLDLWYGHPALLSPSLVQRDESPAAEYSRAQANVINREQRLLVIGCVYGGLPVWFWKAGDAGVFGAPRTWVSLPLPCVKWGTGGEGGGVGGVGGGDGVSGITRHGGLWLLKIREWYSLPLSDGLF